MRKLLAIAAAMVLCAGPALAQVDQLARDCDMDGGPYYGGYAPVSYHRRPYGYYRRPYGYYGYGY